MLCKQKFYLKFSFLSVTIQNSVILEFRALTHEETDKKLSCTFRVPNFSRSIWFIRSKVTEIKRGNLNNKRSWVTRVVLSVLLDCTRMFLFLTVSEPAFFPAEHGKNVFHFLIPLCALRSAFMSHMKSFLCVAGWAQPWNVPGRKNKINLIKMKMD